MLKRRPFPTTFYNLWSLFGAGLALFGAAAMVILYVLDAFSSGHNPYRGIFIFLIFPGVLVFGLLLIPIGMRWEHRRQQRGKSQPLSIDLAKKTHRNAFVVFVSGTCLFLLLATLGLYGGYEYSESVSFCGEVCHVVMEPEFTAHQSSAHAKVKCIECHIGPGAGWYVKSKLDGARQVVKTVLDTYHRPIATPIEQLRPARDVCEQCHWPGKFISSKTETWDYFLGDRDNTHWQIQALMHVGGMAAHGEPTGSHWHVSDSNKLVYVASDYTRQTIDQVTWLRDGKEVVYSRNGEALPDSLLAASRFEGRERTMDCMDCHNRPAHNYLSPMTAVGDALASGAIDPSIPWIKREAVVALSQEYFTREGAMDSIEASLSSFYSRHGIGLPIGTIEAVQAIHKQNFFPRMSVRWDRYPENIGHLNFNGCFRCHGSELRTEDGATISADCNLCHTILAQGPAATISDTLIFSGIEFQHPIDIDGAERAMPCSECHAGDGGLYLPRPVIVE